MSKITFGCLILTAVLTGCVSEIIRSNDDRYLRPGALDPEVREVFKRYEYKLMGEYQVGHAWLRGVNSCQYNQPVFDPNAPLTIAGDIDEKDGVVYQLRDSPAYRKTGNIKYLSIDRYVRSHIVVDKDGKSWEQGLKPMCFAYWLRTQHVLKIDLRRQSIDEQLAASVKSTPEASISKQRVGDNTWHVVTSSLGPAPLNGVGGPYQKWILPVGDSGYIFIFGLGANQDSLQYPAAHSQMQEIFRHLIESVRIEPIQP